MKIEIVEHLLDVLTFSNELLQIGHRICVLSTERIRHSRQKTCPQGVVTGNHNKLKIEKIYINRFPFRSKILLNTY